MLHPDLLKKELDEREEDFRKHSREQADELDVYLRVLKAIEAMPYDEMRRKCVAKEAIGAIPAKEIEQHGFAVSFSEKWKNHEQARMWAQDILHDRITFAADGSQAYLEKETSLPVGAIQVGWFENPHNGAKSYIKSAEFTLLTPKDLLEGLDDPINPESRVGEKRFHAEVKKAEEFITKMKGWQDRSERMPLAFFDGTLLVSFSLPQTDLQDSFIKAMVRLVKHSRDCRVPIIGYVDQSFARDLISLFNNFEGSAKIDKGSLYDSAVIHSKGRRVLDDWGSRTCFCYADRNGLPDFNVDGDLLVGFAYLQTTADSAPARLDIPSWIYEEGLLDELLNVVLAECVVGLGYPYALETADQVAVMSFQDREIMLRALQDFAKRANLPFRVSRKAASKKRRR